MKKTLIALTVILMSGTLTSCYNTKIACGNITTKTPVVKVNSEWNHHFLYGLIPGKNANMEAKEFVEDSENYVIKTNQSFVNGLISCLTFGIYTPSTTTYYLPLKDIKK